MFITIVMTGLDQEMMQKNLSCRNIKDAQKNMVTFSIILVFINLMFLFLGAVMYLFIQQKGLALPERSDELFPSLAINHLGPFAALVFVIGLISAAYPSADGALTSLTTSFSIDILGMKKKDNWPEEKRMKIRKMVHISFAVLLLVVVLILNALNDKAVIDTLFTIAGYTYGPLLGLYSFGLFTKFKVKDKFVWLVAILSPVFCYILSLNSERWMNGYKFGFEMLIVNGLLTFIGLLIISNGKMDKKLIAEKK
jgi:Na+/proline symporter